MRRLFPWLIFGAIAAVLGASSGTSRAQPANSSWPMFHHDTRRTGLSAVNTSNNSGVLEWKFSTGGSIDSSPAIGSDGTVYIGSHDNYVYAINADGTQKWKFSSGYIDSSPAIAADGTIYIGSYDHNLYALNPDGSQKWAFLTGNYVVASPVIGSDGTVYVGSYDGNFYALNPDGSVKWTFTTGTWINSSAAIGTDATIYFGLGYGDGMYALNSDGSKKWFFGTSSYNGPPVTVGSDGTSYLGSGDGLYAVSSNGALKWRFYTDSSESPGIGTDGTIYVGQGSNFYALNPSDGSQKWSFAANGYVCSLPAIGADGTIFTGTAAGTVYALNPNGTQKWAYTTGGDVCSSPAIGSDGTIYVGSGDGNVYALGPATPQFCPPYTGNATISGSMEGNLPINPGDTVQAGYDFTAPGSHPADTITDISGSVTIPVSCPDGSTQVLTIQLPRQSYSVPTNNNNWFPSGDQKSPLVYQGSVTAPADLCGGTQGHAPKGATFTGKFGATTSSKFNVRFHYSDNSAGGWSGTLGLQPVASSTCF